jgi:autotransporter-associated beta strand protein
MFLSLRLTPPVKPTRSVSAFLLAIALAFTAAAAPVPTLDEMAAAWMPVSELQNYPSVYNFAGGLKTEPNLLGVTFLTFAPFSQGSDTAVLTVNGSGATAQQSRWFPYQVERQGDYSGLHIDTLTRLPFEQQGALFSVTVSNTTAQALTPSVSVALRGYISNIGGTWSWSSPRPGTTGFSASLTNGGSVLLIRDTQSAAATAFAFATAPGSLTLNGAEGTATWNPTLAAGQSQSLQFVLAVAGSATQAIANATNWASAFATTFAQAQTSWETRWQSAFQRGNTNFSGSVPVLDTTNSTVRQMYYSSVLTALLLERTGLPQSPRAYVTAGPQWAVTLEYFWDTALWGDLWAQLDPVVMKAHCKDYLAMNIHSCYAKDYLSGGATGPWYAPNDISVFGLWWSYLTATGDWGALNETVGGQTVLQQLNNIALYWQSLVPSGASLADYGGNNNLLECDANYINQVASLNAANVWMMRRMGDLYDRLGQGTNAAALRASAAGLAPKVLALYNGDGTWNCIHNGPSVNVRHCYDYIMLGRCMAEDLAPTVRTQMTAFVENELLVPGWMRAMSLSDAAAGWSNSQRPDHGPIGSYDGWPALTCGVMAQFGQYDKALSLLQRCQDVLQEGPFSQAHQLLANTAQVGAQVNDYPAINPTSAITVEAWMNAAAWRTESWRGSIVSKDDWAGGNAGYVLRCGNNGCLSFTLAQGGAFVEAVSSPVMSSNAWHHVAGTYDGSQVRVFIDGVQQAATARTGALTSSAYPLMVGRATYVTDRAFIGAIDGVRVYGRALSTNEIAAHAALAGAYNAGDTNALALALAFNEGGGNVATNTAPGGLNGSLFDAAAWTNGIEGAALWAPAPSTNPNDVHPRIPNPSYAQDYNEGCGAAFANSIITTLFGFAPDATDTLAVTAPSTPRGFSGTLSGLQYRGALCTIVSDTNGLTATVQTNVVSTPVFTPPAGGYGDALAVTISTTPGATIYYTIDGTPPTTNSTVYAGPIGVPANTAALTVKAFATKPGYVDSLVGSAAYSTGGPRVWTNPAGGSWPVASNWSNSLAASGSSITADFSTLNLTADAIVTLDGARTVGALVFGDTAASHNWTLNTGAGGPLTLDATFPPTLQVNNQTTTLGVSLAGANSLTKSGSGTLVLNGDSTYSGGTFVNAGTLTLAGANNGNSRVGPGPLTLNSGATVRSTQQNPLGWGGATTPALVVNGGTLNAGDYFQFKALTMSDGALSIAANNWINYNDITINASTGSGSTIAGGSFMMRFDTSGNVSGTRIWTVARGTAAADLTVSSALANGGGSPGVASVQKTGPGIMLLLATNTYTGTTLINDGTLLVNGSLGTNTVSVASGASLGGTGSVGGGVTVQPGGTLTPGASGIGTLTLGKTPALAGEVRLEIRKGAVPNADKLAISGQPLIYAGTLTVTHIGTNALAAGDTFTLFSATSFSGSFTATNLPALPAGLGWIFTPTNGVLSVIQVTSPLPTNLVVTVAGGNLTLTWPADHLGWRLETQTNSLSTGLSPNWFTVPGSTNTTTVSLPFNAANPAVFYRLAYP